MRLILYSFVVVYVDGKNLVTADAFFRGPQAYITLGHCRHVSLNLKENLQTSLNFRIVTFCCSYKFSIVKFGKLKLVQ